MGSTDDPSVLARQVPYIEGRHYCVDPETGCWEWTGTLLRGYAHSSGVRPHRRMYLATVGAIPSGCDLHHECHNRACINPTHLRPVERVDHRRVHQREASALTPELVVRLREEAYDGASLVDLAARYGISTSAVDEIVWGRHWPEVGGPIGRPPNTCAFCGASISGYRHRRYCDKTCRNRAQAARRRAARHV